MVRAYVPQSFPGSLVANTIHVPQGFATAPAVAIDPLLAIYPPLGDTDYTNYKFYQVNNGEFDTPQTDFIWEITDTVGPGVFQEASGFDIRPFLNNERDLAQARVTGNTFDPEFLLNVVQLSDDQLHLFGGEFTGTIHEWVLPAPAVFPATGTPSDFTFSQGETNMRDIKFIKNGTEMVIVGLVLQSVDIYSLPTSNSLSTTPVLLQSFDVTFALTSPASCDFSEDGMKLYVISIGSDTVSQWNLTSPFTLPAPSTPVDRTFPFNPDVTRSDGNSRMFPDGSAFYMTSNTPTDQITKYINTDGPNEIPIVNKIPDSVFIVTSLDNNSRAMSVSKDGSLIWFSGRQNDILQELFLPGVLLEYEVVSVDTGTGDFTIKVNVPSIEDLTFIQIAFGNPSATDDSTTLGVGTTLSTFETPLLTKDEDNFLVDDQGRNIMAVET